MRLRIRPFKGKRIEKKRGDMYNLFLFLLHPARTDMILDVGCQSGDFLEKRYPFKANIVAIDMDTKALKFLRQKFPECRIIACDAVSLPFKEKQFDFVVSSQVIEHVGRDSHLLFAKEIERVCKKGYLVTTPNYWFPWEFHYQMPLWQFLPKRLKIAISMHFPVGFYQKREWEDINLLTAGKLKKLFPNVKVGKVGMKFLPETLFVYRNK